MKPNLIVLAIAAAIGLAAGAILPKATTLQKTIGALVSAAAIGLWYFGTNFGNIPRLVGIYLAAILVAWQVVNWLRGLGQPEETPSFLPK